jgi:hypothetical protein
MSFKPRIFSEVLVGKINIVIVACDDVLITYKFGSLGYLFQIWMDINVTSICKVKPNDPPCGFCRKSKSAMFC